jgi:CheY-like chemotaxis protein
VIRALVCSQDGLEAEFQGTMLSRQDVELHHAATLDQARRLAASLQFHLVLVDRDLEGSEALVQALRQEAPTRSCSIVGIARGDFDTKDAELLEAGANALLRLPAEPNWDERLKRLVSVPGRRDVRLPVRLEVVGNWGQQPILALALNLSLHGMLAEAHSELEVGDELTVRFDLPTSDSPISGIGRVVRKASLSRVGLEFLELRGESPQALGAFLAAEAGL